MGSIASWGGGGAGGFKLGGGGGAGGFKLGGGGGGGAGGLDRGSMGGSSPLPPAMMNTCVRRDKKNTLWVKRKRSFSQTENQ